VLTGAILLLIIAGIIAVICQILVASNKRTMTMDAQVKAQDITRIVESYVEDLNIWGTLLDEYGEEVIIENFDDLAEGFYGQSTVIRCVQLAPGGVVTYMHPYEGNEGAYGHDLFADPDRVVEATLARKTGNIILSGPMSLKQGGTGLISRIPVYSNVSDEPDHFWGFAMLVLNMDEINSQLGLEQYVNEGYEYRLWRPNGDERMIADESTSEDFTNAVEVELTLPTNIIWKLAVQPKNGWLDRGYFATLCLTGLIVFILAMTYVEVAYRKKKNREKDLAQQEELAAAERANQAKREFLSKMSHDIRTPINGVIGMTHIALKNPKDSARVEDCLHKIDTSSQYLLSLVNDVLDISRIEAGKEVVNHAPFPMLSVLEKCKTIILGQLEGKQIDFIADFTGVQHPRLVGDALHLEQIFINILGNSVKFTNEGDTISFRVTEDSYDGNTVSFRFVLEDTGIGMSEEFLPKLFNEFSQEVDQSRTTYKGTGLGMAIVKQYVEMLGGQITVESALNVGTKFVILMPISVDPDRSSEEREEQDQTDLTGRKILLVEDNELNAEIAEEMLQDEGADVTSAGNGRIAVEMFKKSEAGQFDLILMDVMMPEMNGLEATRAIRSLDRADAKEIPIIAMTANAFEEDKRSALEAGMNAHVTKPIDVTVLMQTLREQINHR
jgi:signal transduction histidine kinase/CheY-like chemotaxis protein